MSDWQDWFASEVHSAFEYLRTQYGFAELPPSRSECGVAVTFVNGDRQVVASYCPVRLELDVDIAQGQQLSSLAELQIASGPTRLVHGVYEAREKETFVRELVCELAGRFAQQAAGFLEQEPTFWSEVESRRVEREHERIRTEAEQAFSRGDWDEVIAKLSPLEDRLSALDQKRLDYARKCQRTMG